MTPAETASAAVAAVTPYAVVALLWVAGMLAVLLVARAFLRAGERRAQVVVSLALIEAYPTRGLEHTCPLCELGVDA